MRQQKSDVKGVINESNAAYSDPEGAGTYYRAQQLKMDMIL